MNVLDEQELAQRTDKVKRSWAKQAQRYDKSIGFFERRFFGRSHRPWACSRASGDVLEVAIGTGLNLAYYSQDVRLTGVDLSPEMLDIARARAKDLQREVNFREGDAHDLPFDETTFDTVVCTYSLCNIPDTARAVAEIRRVLRPNGRLILVDHIRSSVRPLLWFQKSLELLSVRFEGEHLTRRPLEHVVRAGFAVSERERLGPGGIIERVVATKRDQSNV